MGTLSQPSCSCAVDPGNGREQGYTTRHGGLGSYRGQHYCRAKTATRRRASRLSASGFSQSRCSSACGDRSESYDRRIFRTTTSRLSATAGGRDTSSHQRARLRLRWPRHASLDALRQLLQQREPSNGAAHGIRVAGFSYRFPGTRHIHGRGLPRNWHRLPRYSNLFRAQGSKATLWYPVDGHLTPDGNRLLGEALAERLNASNFKRTAKCHRAWQANWSPRHLGSA